METSWRDKLAAGEIVIIDGGTGSELQRRGVEMNESAWSGAAACEHKDVLREIHADYIRAGAEVITTNTFGTARFVLDAAGLGDAFETINRHAIDAALEAREVAATGPTAVAGSISCLPPNNDISQYPAESVERDAYSELAATLAEGGVDLIALEMMEDTRHSVMALETARETGLPIWLGISCRIADDGTTLVGFDFPNTPIEETLQALLSCEPDVVNIMHSDPDAIEAAISTLRRLWQGPIGVYPELGDFEMPNWNFTSRLTPEDLAERSADWVASGARLLGGCCGTSPEHIRTLSEALPRLNTARRPSK